MKIPQLSKLIHEASRRSGVVPDSALELLMAAQRKKPWDEIGMRGMREYLEAPILDGGAGWDYQDVLKFIKSNRHSREARDLEILSQMDKLRRELQCDATEKLADVGRPKGKVAVRHNTPTNRLSSESQARLLSRLQRDAPDIFAAYGRGEYPSVRQAAIAAGIVKVKTPDEKAIDAWRKTENRLIVLSLIVESLEPHELAALRDRLEMIKSK